MQRLRHLILLLALSMVFLSCEKNRIDQSAQTILRNAESFELYSLNPDLDLEPRPDDFYRWRVIGKVTIDDVSVRTALIDALDSGTRGSDLAAAACFNPRHAIRAKKGSKQVDLLICFECSQIYTFVDGKKLDTVLVSNAPAAAFDRALTDRGVALAPKSD